MGNRPFGTAPLPFAPWLLAMPFALGMFALEELRKWAGPGSRVRKRAREFKVVPR